MLDKPEERCDALAMIWHPSCHVVVVVIIIIIIIITTTTTTTTTNI